VKVDVDVDEDAGITEEEEAGISKLSEYESMPEIFPFPNIPRPGLVDGPLLSTREVDLECDREDRESDKCPLMRPCSFPFVTTKFISR